MTARVVVVGAVNIDLVVSAPRLPGPGETVVGPRVVRTGGGKGANAAVAAAAAGVSTALVGAVGDDDDGRYARHDLLGRGVEVDGLLTLTDEPTGSALIVVDPAGENQIAVGLGANAALGAADVGAAIDHLGGEVDLVLVSTEIPGSCVVAAVRSAQQAGIPCVLNPAPVIAEVVDLLDAGVVLTPNAGEARDLARLLGLGTDDAGEIARVLAARTGEHVVVTLGADGALVAAPDGTHRVLPAASVDRVVDTTGAGDCFNGALAAALATGAPLDDAVSAAIRAAGESVRWAGARPPHAASTAADPRT